MFLSLPTKFLTRRRRSSTKSSAGSAADEDDGPGYPVQESWVTDSSASWKLVMDVWGRPCWLNEVTGQCIYQIEKPTGALTSPYLIDTTGMSNNWPMFPAMLPQNGFMNPSVSPFGPVIFCPPL